MEFDGIGVNGLSSDRMDGRTQFCGQFVIGRKYADFVDSLSSWEQNIQPSQTHPTLISSEQKMLIIMSWQCLLRLLVLPLLAMLLNVPNAGHAYTLKRDHALLAYTPYNQSNSGEEGGPEIDAVVSGATIGFGVGVAIGSIIIPIFGLGTLLGGFFGTASGAVVGKLVYEGKRKRCLVWKG
ncbi:hypothetical protein niasHS_001079 [Heterodera schachtii]|uniref:Uncharacterized protein n=1 Tax=Heterodera schachtii TaxID=97005 RepID=A0ABD2K878_HETSC